MSYSSVSRRVAQKELRLFFSSPVAWLFLAAFAAITLFVFFWVESFFARNIADIRPLFEWMPVLLIFLSAALTMRMWSEERRTGTLEHVLTQPVSLWRFVLGKFRACFSLLLLALLSTAPLPLTVAAISNLDWGPVAAGYLASALLGGAYLSVGLFVSARTDNPIVSLIGSVLLCGLLYLLGSGAIAGFFDNRIGEILRILGTGSRFDSITRGVIDLRDLVYYLTLTTGFLALNVYTLERERWARTASTIRHRRWRRTYALLLINLVMVNIWLHPLTSLRLDLTEGRIYSISDSTREILQQLEEPLLIRGYFSAKTHPLLSPLVPQVRDLLREYEIAGAGKIRTEWIDPAQEPELEQEANERYGIRATPFQVADRYQSALVNSYFDLLVQYGDEHETLGFNELIEVRAAAAGASSGSPPDVRLRNPEFEITRAIREVLLQYRSGGNVFDTITTPLELIAYVSADERLPPALREYRSAISAHLEAVAATSSGKFNVRFVEPEANGGMVARRIGEEWGFTPMVASLGDEQAFFFYLTLADQRQVVQLPTGQFEQDAFPAVLRAGLKRFAGGFTKTVALAVADVHPDMARFNLGGPTFTNLERSITRDYSIIMQDLADGAVATEADILAVVAPHQLSDRSIFAIDQFLMRGGTVILATSPYTAEMSGGELRLQDWDSGLGEWLGHHGITIGDSLVLDRRNAAFPTPVARQSGGYEFRDVKMLDYPYFIDIRDDGLAAEHPVTANLPQLTMVWASPIRLQPAPRGRRITRLLRSSSESWLSADMDIMPRLDADGNSSFQPDETQRSEQLGIVLEGRFDSWFADRELPAPIASDEEATAGIPVTTLLKSSPESSRLVLYSSNDFLDDQVLATVATGNGGQHLGALELFINTLDWALQDDQLMQIRSRGHFNRTLPPMEQKSQQGIEYLNYLLAISWLVLLAIIHAVRKRLRRRRFARGLAL